MNTLEVKNGTKSFNDKMLLQGINMSCSTGDVVGVFGRNGAGKSTLLKMIYGTLPADKMVLMFNRVHINAKDCIPKQLVGYLPQHDFLPKELTVRNVIPLFNDDEKKQDAIFYAPRIAKIENKKIGALSKGELRYLELLLIGNLDHPFLLLDEPFSMVEPLFKEIIKIFINNLKSSKGIFITDHYYADVLHVSTKNYLIKDTTAFPINGASDLAFHGYINNPHDIAS